MKLRTITRGAGTLLLLASVGASAQNAKPLKPTGPKPAWAPGMHDEMQVVIEKLESLGGKPIETLTADEARKQPTPTDAVIAVIKEHNIPVPPSKVDTSGKDIAVDGGKIHARVYTPQNGKGPFPVIVYYHGGGWVIADLDVYDPSARALSEKANAVVVSVAYRQGPEHKFPTAHNDCYAAYEWVTRNAASINGDAKNIALVGESAGGGLAAAVSIAARDNGLQMPVYQVLVYPIAQSNVNTPSYLKNEKTKPLNKAMMQWFFLNYLNDAKEMMDKRIDLVNANLKGLPPTTVITAEIDPLHDDGMMLADKLKQAGVTVEYNNYDGVTHEFFGMAAVLPEAKDAQAAAVKGLKKAFDNHADAKK